MAYEKVYIEVVVRFLKEGGMRPLWLSWKDGRTFEIERVLDVGRKPARVGAVLPVRYACLIRGREKYLYYEIETARWFLEVER